MPKYDYKCSLCGFEEEITHTMAECDKVYPCLRCELPNVRMHRVLRKAPTAVFLGPGFACNDSVARPNVGRNPSNQNRHSRG